MNPWEKLVRGFMQMCGGFFLIYSIVFIPEGLDLVRRGQIRVIDALLQLGFR